MNSKAFKILATVATCMSIAMYDSYIPQIVDNLAGHKTNWLQPLVAAINCTLWVTYALKLKPKPAIPVAVANVPGIFFGLAAFATAL